jgi:hypothetical protein
MGKIALSSDQINQFSQDILPYLNERQRRLFAGALTVAIGHGGQKFISQITGFSPQTINKGQQELGRQETTAPLQRVRTEGGGRKNVVDKQPGLKQEMEKLLEPVTRGHPESVLKWTCLSTRNLSKALKEKGHQVSHTIVSELLNNMGFSLQSNSKRLEGGKHPDRNEQFLYINNKTEKYLAHKLPAISVDTKKKELLGNYKNGGREYRPKKDPRAVNGHDFGKERAAPYGVYDIAKNEGFVNVGTSYDTSAFAVDSIGQWWDTLGKVKYPNAGKLLITADGGGSNGYRVRLWKVELQKLANETGLEITVCHFPPGTSKWNKIEHRLFSYISMNWKGIPLMDVETVVQLIGAVKTKSGLKVTAREELNAYEKGIKVTDREIQEVNISRHEFHGEWNYTIAPIN